MTAGRAAAAMLLVAAVAGCRPLPEEGSADAELYMKHCGSTCHGPYQPRSLTPAMWKIQAERMYPLYRGSDQPVPNSAERERILNYLTRNAGG